MAFSSSPSTSNNSTNILLAFVVGELFVIGWELSLPGFDLSSFALHSFAVQWSLFFGIGLLSTFQHYYHRRDLTYWITAYCLFVLSSVVVIFAYQLLWRYAGTPIQWGEVARYTTIALIVYAVVVRFLFLGQALQQQKTAEMSARLQSLQSRIRPHFLFNTLNSVSSLILLDPERAEAQLLNFTQLLRQNLSSNEQLISLSQEFDLSRRYLQIEETRFGERMQVHFDIESQLLEQILVPPLLLQPILENGVVHGIEPNTDVGQIKLVARGDHNLVKITVSNSMPKENSMANQTRASNGMALENIQHRLQLVFGDKARMTSSQVDGHYQVVLVLPLI